MENNMLVNNLNNVIYEQKKEIEKLSLSVDKLQREKANLIASRTMIVNIENPNELFKVRDMVNKGMFLVDDNNEPFVLAPQSSPAHNPMKPIVHKILFKNIETVRYVKYYEDLEIMPKGHRKLAYSQIWVHHKSYHSISMVDENILQYLISNKAVNPDKIIYSACDLSTGGRYYLGTNKGEEPSQEYIARFKQESIDNINITKSYNFIEGNNDIKTVTEQGDNDIEDTAQQFVSVNNVENTDTGEFDLKNVSLDGLI